MKKLLIAVVVACLCVGPVPLSAETGDMEMVTEYYDGSQNLPDFAFFWMFLGMVKGHAADTRGPDHLWRRVFGIERDSPENSSRLDFYTSWFATVAADVDRAKDSATLETVCSGDWSEMSVGEIIAAMNSREAKHDQVHAEYFAMTLDAFSPEEQSTFRSFMERQKQSMGFTRIDNTKYFESKPESHVRSTQATMCEEVRIAIQYGRVSL